MNISSIVGGGKYSTSTLLLFHNSHWEIKHLIEMQECRDIKRWNANSSIEMHLNRKMLKRMEWGERRGRWGVSAPLPVGGPWGAPGCPCKRVMRPGASDSRRGRLGGDVSRRWPIVHGIGLCHLQGGNVRCPAAIWAACTYWV